MGIELSVARVLAAQMEYTVPGIQAEVKRDQHSYSIKASFTRRGKKNTVDIRDTVEFGLVMAFLEQSADRAGRPLKPMAMFTNDRVSYTELERVG